MTIRFHALTAIPILLALALPRPVCAEGWAPITGQRISKPEYPPLRWQTSFDEFKIGRCAPVNAQAAVGLPGWPVQGFGNEMLIRYSEFNANFRMQKTALPPSSPARFALLSVPDAKARRIRAQLRSSIRRHSAASAQATRRAAHMAAGGECGGDAGGRSAA